MELQVGILDVLDIVLTPDPPQRATRVTGQHVWANPWQVAPELYLCRCSTRSFSRAMQVLVHLLRGCRANKLVSLLQGTQLNRNRSFHLLGTIFFFSCRMHLPPTKTSMVAFAVCRICGECVRNTTRTVKPIVVHFMSHVNTGLIESFLPAGDNLPLRLEQVERTVSERFVASLPQPLTESDVAGRYQTAATSVACPLTIAPDAAEANVEMWKRVSVDVVPHEFVPAGLLATVEIDAASLASMLDNVVPDLIKLADQNRQSQVPHHGQAGHRAYIRRPSRLPHLCPTLIHPPLPSDDDMVLIEDPFDGII